MTKLSGLKAGLFLKQLLDDINPSSLLECYNLSDEENCFTAGHTQTNQFSPAAPCFRGLSLPPRTIPGWKKRVCNTFIFLPGPSHRQIR
ncbi:hypothetical protein CDAR_261281 [Caerostris darwini]|uniref:Uncharacterized protein n=1 Tax=Caerostris darwini TaxID=1538125 RepID=A0AAV4T063_9ARAC|nr:hypothetical protein CDAR_261281 [Caerostris darwini]